MPEYTVFLSGSRFLTTAKLQSKLEKKGQALQIYRKRHLDAGVIAAPRRGGLCLTFRYMSLAPSRTTCDRGDERPEKITKLDYA